MNVFFEYIEYVFDHHIRDIERLESVVYDMCHSKLTSKMFYEPIDRMLARFERKNSLLIDTYK